MSKLALEDLILDDPVAGIFRVHRQTFTDPAILDLERERIFDRCWLLAGHETEIPHTGDFVSRRVGGRPVVLVRGDDGAPRVLLNTCTHRGAQVCRDRSGNATTFQCPFHAWTFNNHGELVAIPGDDAYGPGFDRQELGLKSPAQVASYRGFVFVCFDSTTAPLVDYLADAREFIDLVCDQSAQGLELLPGTYHYGIRCNWKLLAENGNDSYHLAATHARLFDYYRSRGVKPSPRSGVGGGSGQSFALALGNGHALVEHPLQGDVAGRLVAAWGPLFPDSLKPEIARAEDELRARVGEDRMRRIARANRNMRIFPNLYLNDHMSLVLRTFYPTAPDHVEVTEWSLAPRGESALQRSVRLDCFAAAQGPASLTIPDDAEMLESVQAALVNREVAWTDNSRGMTRSGPRHATDELQMRAFWRHWHDLITQTSRHPVMV